MKKIYIWGVFLTISLILAACNNNDNNAAAANANNAAAPAGTAVVAPAPAPPVEPKIPVTYIAVQSASIDYCTSWGYLAKAASLAAEMEKTTGVKPELKEGGDGFFEVTVNGNLIFSKNRLKRFPNPGEVLKLLEQK